jgi:hypothetical protein
LLFTAYISSLRLIFRRHQVEYVIYADDIQIFVTSTASNAHLAIQHLEECIVDLLEWLASSQLSLNSTKTELIFLGSRVHIDAVSHLTLSIAGSVITPKHHVRDLGVVIDSQLSLDEHVNNMCRSAFLYLRIISRQRRFLDKKCTSLLVHSFVFSRLDYCASILSGITKKQEHKMQRVIHYSVRLIDMLRRFDHITQPLADHGLLPIHHRLKFRLALTVYKVLSTGEPRALATLLELQNSTIPASLMRTRSSSDTSLLLIPRTKKKSFGDRAFRYAATKLWNSLPAAVRTASTGTTEFRTLLLHHLLTLTGL